MAGYGGMDDASLDAIIFVENQIALCKLLLPVGESLHNCIECGDIIPEGRRLALPGVSKCISCQKIVDAHRPKIRVTRHIL